MQFAQLLIWEKIHHISRQKLQKIRIREKVMI
jgi:hypothetical protein